MFDLEDFIPYRMSKALENASQSFATLYKREYGLTRADWRVLFHVGQYAPISARDIVDRAGLDKTKISRAVQKLVEKGWIKRSDHQEDRRRQTLTLTDNGQEVLDALAVHAEAHNESILRAIGKQDRKTLMAVLSAIECADLGP